ncbi:MAG: GTPase [Pseudomonadota bacterium]
MNFFSKFWAKITEEIFRDDAKSESERGGLENGASATTAGDIPVIWLLGKTGAGKTSVVSALTGDPKAEIGPGFKPCTRFTSVYSVPPDEPCIQFLDTTGLGEVDYDPTDDIENCESQSHILMPVMRVDDDLQVEVISIIREIRRRNRQLPIVVAQSCLHRLCSPTQPRPAEYIFDGTSNDEKNAIIPQDLSLAIAKQRAQISRQVPGVDPVFVPIDFTQLEDQLPPVDYGLHALQRAIEQTVPLAHQAILRARIDAESDGIRKRARPLIRRYALGAAFAGGTPIPTVSIAALAGTTASLLRALALRYQVQWTASTWAGFISAIGTVNLSWWGVRYGVRELLKIVPLVGTWLGAGLNAASAYALTVGIGEAACVWLAFQRRGQVASSAEVREAFAKSMASAFQKARKASDNEKSLE